MKCLPQMGAMLGLTLLSGCVTPVGPVEVTRFHVPDAALLGRGPIVMEPAQGMDGGSLEYRAYAAAVMRQLVLLGYSEQAGGNPAAQVAVVGLDRQNIAPQRAGGPVSVGMGGGTGGVGLGIGIDLSGPPPAYTATELSVTIRERAGGRSLWEGRARFDVRTDSPLSSTGLGAAKMAEALFKGFPGKSGETIEVR